VHVVVVDAVIAVVVVVVDAIAIIVAVVASLADTVGIEVGGVGDCGGASSMCTAACIAKLSAESNFLLQTAHVTESPVCSAICASL